MQSMQSFGSQSLVDSPPMFSPQVTLEDIFFHTVKHVVVLGDNGAIP